MRRLSLLQNIRSWLGNLAGAELRSDGDLWGYVFRISATCVVAALSVDIANHLLFFDGWVDTIRSWSITTLLAGGIAVPISRLIGKAHLDLYRAKREVEILSLTDPLTGLANRRALIEAVANGCDGCVLAIFDIDRFKRINDTYGHLAGDTVITAVAREMMKDLGALGDVYRLGGEEFAFLARGDASIAERVRQLLADIATAPVTIGSRKVSVTISAGVAVATDGQNFNQLYAEADRALYLAKASGRNRVARAEEVSAAMRAGEAAVAAAQEATADRRSVA